MKRFTALLLLTLALPACASSWQTVDAPPGQFEGEAPEQVRVTTEGGNQYQLRDYRVERDSMIGVGHPVGEETVSPTRTALALENIEQVEEPVDNSVSETDLALAFVGFFTGACISDLVLEDPVWGICK